MAFVPISATVILDERGIPAAGARIYVYEAGTTTPRAVFNTSALDNTRRHPFPVLASGSGRVPPMWVGVGDYDLSIRSDDDVVIETILGLAGDPAPASGGGTTFDPLRQIPTGALVPIYGRGRRAGYVRPNGLTIGPEASAATERNDADCHDLFAWLWNEDTTLTVSGGRGQSAEADWTAGKTITLPDFQGYFEATVSDMGNAAAPTSRLSAGRFDGGMNANTMGGTGGEAAHALTSAQNGRHGHSGTFAGNLVSDHFHGVKVNNKGLNHSHGIPIIGLNVTPGGTSAIYYVAPDPANATAHFQTDPVDLLHDHSAYSDPAGGHTPTGTVTVAADGAGEAHNTLPPFKLRSLYLKL